jgi:hypothetical protein
VPRISVSDAAHAAPRREPGANDVVARKWREDDDRGSLARGAAETRASDARVEVLISSEPRFEANPLQ